MAQVPYSPIPSVQPSQPLEYQRIQASPDAFGADVGRAESQLGSQVQHSADVINLAVRDFQKRQDDTDVDAMYANGFSPAFRDLYQKYYSLQGKAAVDAMPVFLGQMQDLRNTSRDSLPNERQKHLFDQISRRRVEMEMDGMARYADTQNKVYAQETFNSTLDNLELQAADKWNDEAAFGSALGSSRFVIEKYGMDNGKSSEWIRDKIAERDSSAAVARVQRMMIDHPEEADKWYRANNAMIGPKQRPLLEHQIRAALLPIEIKNKANEGITAVLGPDAIPGIQRDISGGDAFPAAGAVANPLAVEAPVPSTPLAPLPVGNVVAGGSATKPESQVHRDNIAQLTKELARKGLTDKQATILNEELSKEKALLAAAPEAVVAVPNATTARDVKAKLGDLMAWAETQYPNDPVKRDALQTQLRSRISTQVAIYEGVQRQAHETLTRLMMPPNGAPPTTLEELQSTPEGKKAWAMVGPESWRGFESWLKQNQTHAEGKALKSNGAVNVEIFNRINLPWGNPDKIGTVSQLMPYFGKGMTAPDFERAQKLMGEQLTSDGQRFSDVRKDVFNALKQEFVSSTMLFHDEKGLGDFVGFQQYAMNKEAQYREAKKDPYLLYRQNLSPGHPNPDYIGNDVGLFKRSLEQKVQDRVDSIKTPGGGVVALTPEQKKKPGESYADWKKRVNP